MTIPRIIAIDGPAASGKSTIAEILAQHLDYLFFDTGVMYRAVTLAALQKNIPIDDEAAISSLSEEIQLDIAQPSQPDGRKYDVFLNGEDVTWEIRSSDVEANVSQVSAYGGVRQAMTRQQRRIGQRGRCVMVGRDIGTVVLPEADLKIYLIASPAERARRRHVENLQRGVNSDYEAILKAMIERDRIDSSRAIAPLKPAEDAHIVDTDGLTIQQVFERVKELMALCCDDSQ
jgi:cytidylate kinase